MSNVVRAMFAGPQAASADKRIDERDPSHPEIRDSTADVAEGERCIECGSWTQVTTCTVAPHAKTSHQFSQSTSD